jgi:hypothetical protein
MNKQLVAEQISAIQNKIKELSKLRFKYFIYGKYIPGFGDIKTIEDITKTVLNSILKNRKT